MCFALIGAIASIAGTAVSAAGSIAAGNQQAAMAEMQAKALEQQRQAEAQSSSYEASREQHRQEIAQSAARAQVGASGVGFAGSPAAVLEANAGQGQLELEAIRYGSALRQNALTTQAALTRFQGKQAKQAGMINAASSVMSGISELYDPNRAIKLTANPFARPAAAAPGGLY